MPALFEAFETHLFHSGHLNLHIATAHYPCSLPPPCPLPHLHPPPRQQVRLPGNLEVLLSDTVGFIQKLPTQLVAAFRATLEEIREASLIVHVLDASADNAAAQCNAVLQVGARGTGVRDGQQAVVGLGQSQGGDAALCSRYGCCGAVLYDAAVGLPSMVSISTHSQSFSHQLSMVFAYLSV
jgi:hypothetical protein